MRYLVNIAQPFTDVLKALGVGDVIDQHDAHGSSVVGGGDGVEPLLARRVPAETKSGGQVCKCDICMSSQEERNSIVTEAGWSPTNGLHVETRPTSESGSGTPTPAVLLDSQSPVLIPSDAEQARLLT